MPQTPRFRPVLDQFAPYVPGKPPSGSAGRNFKLSSNESPFGPLPSVVEVIAQAAADINRFLVEEGLAVHRLEPTRASLEERFLEITSRLGVAA